MIIGTGRESTLGNPPSGLSDRRLKSNARPQNGGARRLEPTPRIIPEAWRCARAKSGTDGWTIWRTPRPRPQTAPEPTSHVIASASAAALLLAFAPTVADPTPDPVVIGEPVELEEEVVIGVVDPLNPRAAAAARFAAQETPGAVAVVSREQYADHMASHLGDALHSLVASPPRSVEATRLG